MAQNFFLEKDSPVDFLYLDRSRLASLIGQMSDRGNLVGLKSVFQHSQGKEGKVSGSMLVGAAEGRLSGSTSQSSEETYDPFWTHAYTFLGNLEQNFAVPLDEARVGSLVRFESFVQFLDLRIMGKLLEPVMKAALGGKPGSVATGKKGWQQKQPEAAASPEKLGYDLFREIPHLLQMNFIGPDGIRLWAVAQPENLTINSDALLMKFGAVIEGLWAVVGIVDGVVGEPPEPFPVNPLLDAAISAMAQIRGLFGRPNDHLGLTPIAIYAPVLGFPETQVSAPHESAA